MNQIKDHVWNVDMNGQAIKYFNEFILCRIAYNSVWKVDKMNVE